MQVLTCKTGFLVFKISESQFFIESFHIGKNFRQSPKAFLELMSEAREIALASGCTHFGTNLDVRTLTCNEVLKAELKYGFKITGVHGALIGLKKDILNG